MAPIKEGLLLPHVQMGSHALNTKDMWGSLLPFVAATFSWYAYRNTPSCLPQCYSETYTRLFTIVVPVESSGVRSPLTQY
jgi:hypothetical protein